MDTVKSNSPSIKNINMKNYLKNKNYLKMREIVLSMGKTKIKKVDEKLTLESRMIELQKYYQ